MQAGGNSVPALPTVSSLGASFCAFERGGGSAHLDMGAWGGSRDCLGDSMKFYVKLLKPPEQVESKSQEGKDHDIHKYTWVSLGSTPDSGHMCIVRDVHPHRPGG